MPLPMRPAFNQGLFTMNLHIEPMCAGGPGKDVHQVVMNRVKRGVSRHYSTPDFRLSIASFEKKCCCCCLNNNINISNSLTFLLKFKIVQLSLVLGDRVTDGGRFVADGRRFGRPFAARLRRSASA